MADDDEEQFAPALRRRRRRRRWGGAVVESGALPPGVRCVIHVGTSFPRFSALSALYGGRRRESITLPYDCICRGAPPLHTLYASVLTFPLDVLPWRKSIACSGLQKRSNVPVQGLA